MTPRERVIRALTSGRPDRAPHDLWSLPGIAMFRPDQASRRGSSTAAGAAP